MSEKLKKEVLKAGALINGKYKIIREIGRGGMSVVYLAEDLRLKKRWAVKVISKGFEKTSSCFIAEADILKNIDHSAFPRIVDISESPDIFCIVMDYIEGKNIGELVAEGGPRSEETVLDWAGQLAIALGYLHSKNPPILYLDMKPSNVIITPEGSVKIIDFGIAKRSRVISALGTRGYAPPEQYLGAADVRSDIYALGMTLYFALTGKDPGKGAVISIRKARPEISRGLCNILAKCIEHNPSDRYRNCDELLKDLKNIGNLLRIPSNQRKIRKFAFFAASVLLSAAVCAGSLFFASDEIKNDRTYESRLTSDNSEDYYDAISIYPNRTDAYYLLIDYCKTYGASNDELARLGNAVQNNFVSLGQDDPEVLRLYYDVGKLIFSAYDDSLRMRAVNSVIFFKMADESDIYFEEREISSCYLSVCNLLIGQSITSEATFSDYEEIFKEINSSLILFDEIEGSESNYDKMTFYYAVILFINSEVSSLAASGFSGTAVLEMIYSIYSRAKDVTSSLDYVNNLKEEISSGFQSYIANIDAIYSEFFYKNGG